MGYARVKYDNNKIGLILTSSLFRKVDKKGRVLITHGILNSRNYYYPELKILKK